MTTVYSPQILIEAYKILSTHREQVKVLAGGTDLMVLYNSGTSLPALLLDLWLINELRNITETEKELKLGALLTYTQLITDQALQQHAPCLVNAAHTIGAVQIQNRGTLGGNIVNASPAGDTLPVLAAFDAELIIGCLNGMRAVPFNQFYTGYRQTVLAADELLVSVCLPKQQADETTAFYKVGTRAAQAISKVVMAIRARIDVTHKIQQIAIALGSVAPTVIRAYNTEATLLGETIDTKLMETARQHLMAEIKPISDIRSTADYRRRVVGNLIVKFLREAVVVA
jgi:CO/xanthine dehydrogenase FAD-binding subunit